MISPCFSIFSMGHPQFRVSSTYLPRCPPSARGNRAARCQGAAGGSATDAAQGPGGEENHPPVITIFIGGIFLLPVMGGKNPQSWVVKMALFYPQPLVIKGGKGENCMPKIRTEPYVCPEPVFSRTKRPFFPRTPTKSAKGCCRKLLWNEPWSKFCVVRLARGHT